MNYVRYRSFMLRRHSLGWRKRKDLAAMES